VTLTDLQTRRVGLSSLAELLVICIFLQFLNGDVIDANIGGKSLSSVCSAQTMDISVDFQVQTDAVTTKVT